jgi:DNA-binding FadR family transcriptional regulator
LGASRGTVREGLKILECQGLIASKPGPGGGVFIREPSHDDAIGMMENLFLFSQPSIAGIYALRKIIEPHLAADAARRRSPKTVQALQATIRLYEDEPKTAKEEYAQRLAELDFHAVLARACDDSLFAFIGVFLLRLLREMTVCRTIYKKTKTQFRQTGLHYQVRLLRAIKAGDAARARKIMQEHMREAEKYMLERAAVVTRGLRLAAKKKPRQTRADKAALAKK